MDKLACVPSKYSDQSAQRIRIVLSVFAVLMKKLCIIGCQKSSAYFDQTANAQADLNLCCAHMEMHSFFFQWYLVR